MLEQPPKHNVLEVAISATSYGQVVETCREWVAEKRSSSVQAPARYVCVASVHGVITAHDDLSVRRILNGADIVTPDGMPLVWALRSLGMRMQQRVYGPHLMQRLCESAALHGHKIFLYGATPECLSALSQRLSERYPGLEIAGAFAPPFRELTEQEDAEVDRRILDSGADLVFVGLSTPKQERWMWAHRATLPGLVLAGVGAAFDFNAGHLAQAPAWMQSNGLEWLFRLLMEPARLWRRYLLVTPRFIPLWMMQRFAASWNYRSRRIHAGQTS